MSRPMSMPDFSQLSSASSPHGHGNDRPRKKPSLSLAAGLIMASESPKALTSSPKSTRSPKTTRQDNPGGESLFYAYAIVSESSNSEPGPPSLLTFANSSVAQQWWERVQTAYPASTRQSSQFFTLKGKNIRRGIRENATLQDLKPKWFWTAPDAKTAVIPLQDEWGRPVGQLQHAQEPTQTTVSEAEQDKQDKPFDLTTLSATLDRMNTLITENATHIRALSVAQSSGLQRMQEINESNSSKIKALADTQSSLQQLVQQSATHFIALSNSSFSASEQLKTTLRKNEEHINALIDGQHTLATTCAEMMKTIRAVADAATLQTSTSTSNSSSSITAASPGPSPFSTSAVTRISPPPRKLNRRVKSVWYEYDNNNNNTNVVAAQKTTNVMVQTTLKAPVSSA